MSNDEWITVSDASKITGYNEEHITRLIREGKIKAKKFSIVWQVSRSSLLAYLARTEKLGNKRGPKPKL
jgi:excisionase family DNA binding protein